MDHVFLNTQRSARPLTGFTMVELLVTIAIVAVLAAAAVPTFQGYMARTEMNAQISALASSLRLAKSEALKRAMPVTVCPSANPEAAAPTCSGGADWSTGWLVFSDRATRNQVDEGIDTVVARQSAFPRSGGIRPQNAGYTITFSPNGLAIGAQTTFTFKSYEAGSTTEREIVVNAQGSTRLQ